MIILTQKVTVLRAGRPVADNFIGEIEVACFMSNFLDVAGTVEEK